MSLLEFLVLEVTLIFVGVIVYVIQVAMIDPYLYKLKMLNIIKQDLQVVKQTIDKDPFAPISLNIWREFTKSDALLILSDDSRKKLIEIYSLIYSKNNLTDVYFTQMVPDKVTGAISKSGKPISIEQLIHKIREDLSQKFTKFTKTFNEEISNHH